ncbi:MAG: glutamine-hydrolyzing carbamoyl-phosphate synthase small subunit [Candidatus Aminicenantes bacterium]|nr:MAG: glutamine-hydrolyzing carbamoyl-phosphate synthase small subunit [Candidatus Aminicenantes bacterium]
MKEASLKLEDGTKYPGTSFGAEKSISGEVVFNTGMVGYYESLTDPSYKGQILVLTYPLIGNYGVPGEDNESQLSINFESDKIHASALVVTDYSYSHNHWNAARSLSDWLEQQKIPALHGIDTRALTKRLREEGTMLGKLVFEEDVEFYDPNRENLIAKVTVKEPVFYNEKGKWKVVIIDCGVKYNIIRSLIQRDCCVIRIPCNYDFFDITFDGVVISNGPGDPKMCPDTIALIRKCFEKTIPTFGICLGNQLMALAAGANTYKLKYGHRSQNQPCLQVGTKRCFITSQNHGYAVETKSLPKDWEPWFTNVNDNTNEGIKHKHLPFRSVQFHPEHSPGPVDTAFLFDEFLELIRT